MKKLQLTDPPPAAVPDPAYLIEFELWKLAIKEHQHKVQEYQNFHARLYNIVLGQCTKVPEARLRSHQDWESRIFI